MGPGTPVRGHDARFSGIGFGLAAIVHDAFVDLPPVPRIEALAVSPVVLDRNDRLLRPFTTPEGRWRLPVRLQDVDRHYLDMLIGYEDQGFYAHDGVDWSAMLRAGLQFVAARGGHIVSGGSTLTMQVARLIDTQSTRSLAGKLRQMAFALRLEETLSKDEILTLYLTLAPLWRQYRRGAGSEPVLFRQGTVAAHHRRGRAAGGAAAIA